MASPDPSDKEEYAFWQREKAAADTEQRRRIKWMMLSYSGMLARTGSLHTCLQMQRKQMMSISGRL